MCIFDDLQDDVVLGQGLARPADVLPLIGWTPSDQSDALPAAAVVRSWEDRFGARLLRVGFAQTSLLTARPPRSTGHAQRSAAEHVVCCDECAGHGLSDIPRITASPAGRRKAASGSSPR
jgi:Domain of unknown function (DUF4253)